MFFLMHLVLDNLKCSDFYEIPIVKKMLADNLKKNWNKYSQKLLSQCVDECKITYIENMMALNTIFQQLVKCLNRLKIIILYKVKHRMK